MVLTAHIKQLTKCVGGRSNYILLYFAPHPDNYIPSFQDASRTSNEQKHGNHSKNMCIDVYLVTVLNL